MSLTTSGFVFFHLQYETFLESIQSPLVSSKLQQCLQEAWPVILHATALDAVPKKHGIDSSSASSDEVETESTLISGYRMVELESREFEFIWGFALLMLFKGQNSFSHTQMVPTAGPKFKVKEGPLYEETNRLASSSDEVAFLVFQSLSIESFFRAGFLSLGICKELLQVMCISIIPCFGTSYLFGD